MKTRKIIGGVLGCLMLCGLLVGCSGSNNSSSNSNYKKGTVTESKFTSEWMVDHAGRVIAVFNGEKGGTKNTIDYAERQNIPVIYIP